ncbi:hypothetical protein DL96DRAFT_1579578 [Flagelloscypha sp. PMI_526]|nr:hypothetical protein DL96DRAFT_1579578 [Flagelloscypha sp. PMI_526]
MVVSSRSVGFFNTLLLVAQLVFLPLVLCDVKVPWEAVPFTPHAFPLAVRSPYLSTWYIPGTGDGLNKVWPTFWAGQITGWAGFVRVDGKTYSFLGASAVDGLQLATQTRAEFTSTQSKFQFTAGPVTLNVTFFSPVEPNDPVKQSMPFSYMSVTAQSADGAAHAVQVYSDISAEWASGDPASLVNWQTTTTNGAIIHSTKRQVPLSFTEIKDQTERTPIFLTFLHALTISTEGTDTAVTWQSGADKAVRTLFLANGKLDSVQDTNFRAVNDQFVVFGIAKDLGQVSSTPSAKVTWAVGLVRDPAVQYIQRSLYFFSAFATAEAALISFLKDFDAALTRGNSFDAKVRGDASKISPDYSAIVDLSVRQAFGSIEITLAKNADGTFNTGDPHVFMKEISSSGNVYVKFSEFIVELIFSYTNPVFGKYLIEPLLKYQATGQYPNKFASHDLGAHYPNATGHNDGKDEAMPLEESANMLIMALHYAQKTNDNTQLEKYRALFDQWNGFLIQESLAPDDFLGKQANSTNLALKGLIGMRAMAEIEGRLGDTGQKTNLTTIQSNIQTQVLDLAKAKDGSHLMLPYGNETSWGLTYNMYADRLIGTNIIPQEVLQMQTKWYSTLFGPFGIPLDTRSTKTKTDWMIWTSAFMTDTNTRDLFIQVYGLSKQPLGDFYDSQSGKPEGFKARPVVGGHFALLALDPAQLTKQTNGGGNLPNSSGTSNTGTTTSGTNTNGNTGTTQAPNSAGRSLGTTDLSITVVFLCFVVLWA